MNEPQGCLYSILRLLGLVPPTAAEPPAEQFPYKAKEALLTRGEIAFFAVLLQAVSDQQLVLSMVRLADVLYIPKGTERWQSHFNRIQSKHLDFVLCDKATLRPLLAIELDDATHRQTKRRQRDDFLNQALASARLPLLRVPAAGSYAVESLREDIEGTLNS